MSFDIARYWERRYLQGRDSGEGSRGENALTKARFVNQIIREHGVKSVVDWGCGDGQVLRHFTNKVTYTGVDVSPSILTQVSAQHPKHVFMLAQDPAVNQLRADLALSMDVLFHLVNDTDYHQHLEQVFRSAGKLVIIYSTNYDGGRTSRHVLRRQFTPDIQQMFPGWQLMLETDSDNEQAARFFAYGRVPWSSSR